MAYRKWGNTMPSPLDGIVPSPVVSTVAMPLAGKTMDSGQGGDVGTKFLVGILGGAFTAMGSAPSTVQTSFFIFLLLGAIQLFIGLLIAKLIGEDVRHFLRQLTLRSMFFILGLTVFGCLGWACNAWFVLNVGLGCVCALQIMFILRTMAQIAVEAGIDMHPMENMIMQLASMAGMEMRAAREKEKQDVDDRERSADTHADANS